MVTHSYLGAEMEPDDLAVVPHEEENDQTLTLQFPVATLKDSHVNLRAYFNSQGYAEWLWSRVQDYLGIQTYGGKYLSANMTALQADLATLGNPPSQIHYKEKGYVPSVAEPWKEHTLEPRALLSCLLTSLKAKQGKAEIKNQALKLLLLLSEIASKNVIGTTSLPPWPSATVTAKDGSSKMIQVQFSKYTTCVAGWAEAMQECPAAQALWDKLSTLSSSWKNQQLSTHWTQAALKGILCFLLHLATHPKLKMGGQVLWEAMGCTTLTSFLHFFSTCLEEYAKELATQPLSELPVMRTKQGHARKSFSSDGLNKALLLQRHKKERLHRWRIAKTHSNLVPQHCVLMKREPYLMSVLYDERVANEFAGVKQLSVAWDPSNYGGSDTFVGMVYSVDRDLAGYLLVQPLRRLLMRDLDDELVEQGRKGELSKLEGYIELRALSASLKNLGISLVDFAVPKGLRLAPLKPGEVRVKGADGRWYIGGEEEGFVPQIPFHLDLSQMPCLISISDQGPQNMPALNYIQYSENALVCHCLFDAFHRAWNDIKLATKRATSYPYRTILELTVVYNLAYGPFGSGSWFKRKVDCLQDFLHETSVDSAIFQEHLPLICRELNIDEPHSQEGQEQLLNRLAHLRSFNEKGPLVKLMRWFSYFESALFYEGELFATRMILQKCGGQFEDEMEAPAKNQDIEPPPHFAQDPRKELAALKKKKGTWKLCPQLITDRNVDLQRMLLTVCRATWKHHASRAREIKSPQQVLQWNIAAATDKAWAAELEDMVRHSCWERKGLHQQFHEEAGEDRSGLLPEHANFLDELLCTRTNSLAVSSLWPPNRYNGTLSFDPSKAAAALQQVDEEWTALMDLEAGIAQGGVVSFYESLVWTKAPFVRALFLAYEHDAGWGCALQRQVAQNLGDSRGVEVAHSNAKDVTRESRSNDVGLTSIQHQLQMSGALEEREVATVKVPLQDKLFSPVHERLRTPLIKKMNPRGHKLPLSLQRMMEKQGVTLSWPSPSPSPSLESLQPLNGSSPS